VGASTVVFPGCLEAETLEALACREAISLAKDIGARRIHVASDFMNVVRSLKEGTKGAYAHIAHEIIESLGEFDEASFCHEKQGQIRRLIALLGVLFMKRMAVE
jgi:hypothetical protein